MRSLRGWKGPELAWTRIKGKGRGFELKAGEEVLGTLWWEKGRGSLARAQTGDGVWSFKRVGFFRSRFTVFQADSDIQVGELEPTWRGGGTLVVPSSGSYLWKGRGVFRMQWEFRDSSDQPLVGFKPKSGFRSIGAAVEVLPAGARVADLPLLVAFGFYLVVLAADDAAAAVVAGAS